MYKLKWRSIYRTFKDYQELVNFCYDIDRPYLIMKAVKVV